MQPDITIPPKSKDDFKKLVNVQHRYDTIRMQMDMLSAYEQSLATMSENSNYSDISSEQNTD